MISFDTTRFGMIEVEEDRVINFPEGLLGFQGLSRYILLDYKDTTLKWLQAVDDPDIAFIVSEPSLIDPNVSIEPDFTTKRFLEIEKSEDLAVLVIIRVKAGKIAANFGGPIFLNAAIMKGIQVVLDKPNNSKK